MPAATNRADLHAVTVKEFDKLNKLLSSLSNAQVHFTYDGTTIKDVIAHRAHWTALFFGWYDDGQDDKPVYFPAKGYNWGDLKRYNTELKTAQADLTWDTVQQMLHDSYQKLINFIDKHSDEDLYCGPMKGANNTWTTGRWAEAAGASHYRSAAKYVRAAIKASA